jgi:hypothetical protein
VLRRLARADIAIEKQKHSNPGWWAGRLALLRNRILRQPETPPPKPPVPDMYRSEKISNWLKDHNRRITNIIEDSACKSATGLHDGSFMDDYRSACSAVAAFNAHMAPIAELYGFKLEMEFAPRQQATGGWVITDIRIVKDPGSLTEAADYALALHGDVNKALSVLTYLCSEKRTPEIDWMLDIVTLFGLTPPPDGRPWRKPVWNRLRHTKRGRGWRKKAKLLEQDRQRKSNRRMALRDPGPDDRIVEADDRDHDQDAVQGQQYAVEGNTDDPAANDEFQPKKGFLKRD